MTVLKRKKALKKPRNPGKRWTPMMFELMPLEFCDRLPQGMNQTDAARYARFKKPAHDGVRLMKNPLIRQWLAEHKVKNYTPFEKASAREELENRQSKTRRQHPANALLMPWKIAKTRHFKKAFRETPANALVMPTNPPVQLRVKTLPTLAWVSNTDECLANHQLLTANCHG